MSCKVLIISMLKNVPLDGKAVLLVNITGHVEDVGSAAGPLAIFGHNPLIHPQLLKLGLWGRGFRYKALQDLSG